MPSIVQDAISAASFDSVPVFSNPQDEEGEGGDDEDLPPLEEEGADEGSRMEEVD